MQALHKMHYNARVCMIGIIIGIRNHAEIMQIMQILCRNYAENMQKLYRNYAEIM